MRHDSLSQTILQGTLEGGRYRGVESLPTEELLTITMALKKTEKGSHLNRPSGNPHDLRVED